MNHTIGAARLAGAAAVLAAAAGLSACGGGASTAKTPSTAKAPAPAASTTTASTAAATTPASASPSVVKITENEFKIQPSVASVSAGRVEFDVTNTGKVKHQLTIIHTSKSAATVLSKTKPNDDIPGAKGEIARILPGKTEKLVVKHLKPGHYALVCALPGHYQAGMYADFTVS